MNMVSGELMVKLPCKRKIEQTNIGVLPLSLVGSVGFWLPVLLVSAILLPSLFDGEEGGVVNDSLEAANDIMAMIVCFNLFIRFVLLSLICIISGAVQISLKNNLIALNLCKVR